MDLDDQNLLWSLLDDDQSSDKISNDNRANSTFMTTTFPYSPPRSHLSTVSMDSGVESPSHANNQQGLTDDSQSYFSNYHQPCYNSSISTSSFHNTIPVTNKFTISYPADICAYNVSAEPKWSQAQLKILEEPKTIFRFRYETEMQGPHGMIQAKQHNKNQKIFPTVALQNFEGSEEVMIRCTLHQYKNENNEEVDFLHPHKLIMRSGEVDKNDHDPHYMKVTRQNDFTAVFQGLGIIQTKKDQMEQVFYQKLREEKEFEVRRRLTEEEDMAIQESTKELMRKKININQVRLGYTAYVKSEMSSSWVRLCGPIFSSVINNKKSGKVGDLKICRMSTHTSEADGNQELFMFVSKVDKNTIKVRFFETKDGDPESEPDWSADGRFSPSDVHHQFGIVLKTPPYKDKFIEKSVKVFVQLFRSSDGETSEPLEFVYKPNSQNRRKRPHYNPPNIPTAVEDYESTHRNFPQSNTASFGNAYAAQFFTGGGGGGGGSSNQSDQQEETEAELNFLLRIVTSELCSDKLAEGELVRYCLDLGNDSELAIDAAEPGHVGPTERELNLSVLEKLKLIMKLFKDNYEEGKIRDMMMAIIKAAEERDENLLIDVIQYGTMNDIKELVMILVKYRLLDVFHSKNDVDQNALHLSILLGYTNLLRVLIKCGVDVNAADAFGLTPLHLAVKNDSLAMVQDLLNTDGIELDPLDDNGNSALHLSVENNNLEVAKLLIAAGATLTLQNPTSGYTCLHTAVNNQIINRNLINYLIEADQTLLSIESNHGMTILGLAHANKVPPELINHLSAFYDTSIDEDDEEAAVFDEQCFKELCEIFDEDDNWQVWVIRMDLVANVAEWITTPSPSRALLQHLLNAKKKLQDFIELFDLLDDDERDSALNAIDEMTVRKFSK